MRQRHEITPKTRDVVLSLAKEHPDWKGTRIKLEVDRTLKRDGPGVRAIQKIVKGRKEYLAHSEIDEPWHLDTLDKFPVPADALPIILETQRHIDKNISIRMVKWLRRLYLVLKGREFLKGDWLSYCLNCYFWAYMYAEREQISEISGVPFDSSDLDAGLLGNNPLSLPVGSDLSPESARLSISYVDTVLGWLNGEQNLMSKEEKQHIAELCVNKIEEGLAGQSLGGWNKESVHYPDVLLPYLLIVLSALESGYFYELSSDQRRKQLIKIREKLLQPLEGSDQMDLESFAKFCENFGEDLKIEKE